MPYLSYKPSTSTYERVLDILASRNVVLGTYTLDADTVTADSDGAKFVREGTILSTYNNATGESRFVKPHISGETAIAVLLNPVDLRYGDVSETVVFQGWIIEPFCTDDGTFGSVVAQTKTDLEHRINFVKEQLN